MAEWKGPAILMCFVSLLAAERLFPLRKRTRPALRRLAVNLALSVLVLGVGSLGVRTAALAGAEWGTSRGIGLCRIVRLPPWATGLLGVLLMDLTFYYWHLANHKVALLWRFHNVHHIDPDLDVSTSFRFHFVEISYSAFFRLAQVLLLGIGPSTYVIYEVVFTCGTIFHHSNLRLPFPLERWLNKVVVTPRMHGVHHGAVLCETDSNYSVIFSWWDRLHGTLVLNIRQCAINIGVPAYRYPEDNKLWSLVVMPFSKQRDYWGSGDGSLSVGSQVGTAKPSQMLP